MAVDREAEARLRVPGRVVVATGQDPSAHRWACRAARAAASNLFSLRTTGEYVGIGPGTVPETATAVEFAPDVGGAEATPVHRVDGDGPRRVVATDPSGLVAAVPDIDHRSDEPPSVCVDSLRPVRQHGTDDDLFWVLWAIGSMLVGEEWDCHVHHPVAPEASLPPALDHLIDERVGLSGQRPPAGTLSGARGEWASD